MARYAEAPGRAFVTGRACRLLNRRSGLVAYALVDREPNMRVSSRSVADILREQVSLEVECIDRMYLNVYVPILQTPGGISWFFREHRGHDFASSSLMAPMTVGFVKRLEEFSEREGVDMLSFKKGVRKDDIAKEYLAKFQGEQGVLFIGKAQEKARLTRTERRHNERGESYAWLVESTGYVNHYYVYCVDRDFGPFFLKFCSYFPYNAKLCINGHEYAKRQLERRGVAYEALDNGILSCADSQRLQRICDELDDKKIDALLRKWLGRLPHPFAREDRAAGFRYEISTLQAEFSLTQVFDRPVTGRHLFEQVIRDNLDIGRPDQVQLIFDRRVNKKTPGRFRTRVITDGVLPSLHVDYKHSQIKQYYKEGRALRTETTINDTYDFTIGRSLHNLAKLRKLAFQANRRLLDVQRISHDCSIGEDTFDHVNRPVVVNDQRASALRFGDSRVMALLNAIALFHLLPMGFSNADLRERVATLLAIPVAKITSGRMAYDLRRLRLHGMIAKIPKSHRYRVTREGMRIAICLLRSHTRMLSPVMAAVADPAPPSLTPLNAAIGHLDHALDKAWRDVA